LRIKEGTANQGTIPPFSATAPTVQPIPRATPTTNGVLTTGGASTAAPTVTALENSSNADPIAILTSRGVQHHRVEHLGDGVRLIAHAPIPNETGAVRVIDARGRDLADAVQAAVQQIDAPR
jgi:hypothetical protein